MIFDGVTDDLGYLKNYPLYENIPDAMPWSFQAEILHFALSHPWHVVGSDDIVRDQYCIYGDAHEHLPAQAFRTLSSSKLIFNTKTNRESNRLPRGSNLIRLWRVHNLQNARTHLRFLEIKIEHAIANVRAFEPGIPYLPGLAA